GGFELIVPQDAKYLIISYMGYKTETIPLAGVDTTLSVHLTPTVYLLQEISVYASSSTDKEISVSVTQLQSKQIEQVVGMTKDALRAVQTLPSVSINNEASAKYNVRGGTSDENLVLVNGVRVYEPFHLKEDPLTSLSIFNLDMVRKIDFSSGAFSAEYGDVLSSILSIEYKTEAQEKLSGKANMSLIDASFLLEGPVSSKGSWIFGLRKSYLEYMLKTYGGNPGSHPSFYDIQGQVHYEFTPNHKLRFTAIHSGDDFRYDPTVSFRQYWSLWRIRGENVNVTENKKEFREVNSRYSNDLFSLKLTNLLSPKLLNETLVSYYCETVGENGQQSAEQFGDFHGKPQCFSIRTWEGNFCESNSVQTLEGQAAFTYQLTPLTTLKSGATYQHLAYSTDREFRLLSVLTTNVLHFPDTTTVIEPPDPAYNDTTHLKIRSYKLGAYLEGNWQLSDNFIIRAGGRVDYFDMNKELTWSPRLGCSYRLPFGTLLRAGAGVFQQFPSYRQLKIKEPSKDNTKSQHAFHYVVGMEHRFRERFLLKLEGFYKKYGDLIAVQRGGDGSLHYGKKENNAEGFARGIDFYGAVNWSGSNAWLSYCLLEAKEKLVTTNEGYYSRYTDQRHTLSLGLSADMGKGWEFSVRGFYGSGYAYTPYVVSYDTTLRIQRWVLGSKHTEHYPSYKRVDVRISKEFVLFHRPLLLFLDVMNIFDRRNVFSYRYTYSLDGKPQREARVLLPLILSVGISYSF
ncbi:MAG: TonB-dependent receptor, partial [candidate division KSB1 bacterium]|nr:TonB-dependent receptor [candidate division KSB1 bacterium]